MSQHTQATYSNSVLVARVVFDTTAQTVTTFDGGGNQTAQRAMTAGELALYQAIDASSLAATNLSALLAKAANALTNNTTYLAIGAPTNAQVVAQVNALTLQVDALIRVVANQLSSQAGT